MQYIAGIGRKEAFAQCERCILGRQDKETELWQKSHRCSLVTYPSEKLYPPGASGDVFYMGGPTTLSETGQVTYEVDDAEHGCPGGWYRCGFWGSIAKYRRAYSADGVFSSNLLLDRCEDKLIIEAIAYYEQELIRATSYNSEQEIKDMRRKQG